MPRCRSLFFFFEDPSNVNGKQTLRLPLVLTFQRARVWAYPTELSPTWMWLVAHADKKRGIERKKKSSMCFSKVSLVLCGWILRSVWKGLTWRISHKNPGVRFVPPVTHPWEQSSIVLQFFCFLRCTDISYIRSFLLTPFFSFFLIHAGSE